MIRPRLSSQFQRALLRQPMTGRLRSAKRSSNGRKTAALACVRAKRAEAEVRPGGVRWLILKQLALYGLVLVVPRKKKALLLHSACLRVMVR